MVYITIHHRDTHPFFGVYVIISIFLVIKALTSCRVITNLKEMQKKSKTIEDMRFSLKSEGVYDGGQTAMLKQ